MNAAQLQLLDNDFLPTWKRSGYRPSVIDLIFVKDRFDPNTQSFLLPSTDYILSDHRLLKWSIPWQEQRAFKLRLKRDSEEEATFLRNILESQWYTEKDPESSASNLRDLIHKLWHQHATAVSNRNKTFWWNDEVADAYNTVLETRLSGNQHDTRQASNSFRRKMRDAKRKFYDEALNNMANSHKPWEAVQWTRARRTPPLASIKNRQNSPIQSLEELWDTLHAQYSDATNMCIDDSIVQDLPSKQERPLFAISNTEIQDALSLCSNVSAPGPDRLTWYHLKHLIEDNAFLSRLAALYNDILDLGVWPSAFKESFSVVIPKPNKPHHDTAKMYRPIALLNTLSKLFTKVLAKRLNQECTLSDLLYKGQCGGVEEHSTTDAGLSLLAFIQDAQRKGLCPSFLTFDIAQFFPSINHDLLCQILQRLGFSSKLVKFFSSFFSNRHTTYAWGSFKSPLFPFSLGVPQGDCLSPILAAIYIAVLFILMERRFGTTNKLFLSFVDDGGIAVASQSYTQNCQLLQDILLFATDNTNRLGLRIEDDKTEFIHFRTLLFNKWHYPRPTTITVNNKTIQNKDILRYLGFFFDQSLSFNHHVQFYTNKGYSSLLSFRMLGNSMRGLLPSMKSLLYRAIAFPIMTYGAALWFQPGLRSANKHLGKLQVTQNLALRFIT
ncbi:hypothetical protein AX17_002205, partial [Amanita inopinata Kibby_2008]